jgi:hypothetical protein
MFPPPTGSQQRALAPLASRECKRYFHHSNVAFDDDGIPAQE